MKLKKVLLPIFVGLMMLCASVCVMMQTNVNQEQRVSVSQSLIDDSLRGKDLEEEETDSLDFVTLNDSDESVKVQDDGLVEDVDAVTMSQEEGQTEILPEEDVEIKAGYDDSYLDAYDIYCIADYITSIATIREIYIGNQYDEPYNSYTHHGYVDEDIGYVDAYRYWFDADNGYLHINLATEGDLRGINPQGLFYNDFFGEVTSITFGDGVLNYYSGWSSGEYVNFSYMFADCYVLEYIYLNWGGSDFYIQNMSHIFQNCYMLTSNPFQYYYNSEELTDISYAFYCCQNIIDFTLFAYTYWGRNVNASYAFANCDYLTDVDFEYYDARPGGNSVRINASHMFEYCTSLEELPSLFRGNDNGNGYAVLSNATYMFAYCENLKTFNSVD